MFDWFMVWFCSIDYAGKYNTSRDVAKMDGGVLSAPRNKFLLS